MQTALSTPRLICVIVNWNGWQDTIECLDSLRLQDYPNLGVVLVDNGSTNDSLAQLRAAHPWPTYIASPENLGFPRACNLAAAHPLAISADFLWLLNNDTITPPDTASQLIAAALANPRAGVIGSVLFYAHDPARIQAWGGGRISRWTAYNTHFLAPTPLGADSYITFASALIRRPCFDFLGGLFAGVFMYFEDPDFCLRAVAAGWQLTVAPDTAILHKEGASVRNHLDQRATPARSPMIERIVTLSGLAFLARHAPIPPVAQTLFLALRLARRLVRLDWPSARAVLNGFADFRRAPRLGVAGVVNSPLDPSGNS